MITLYYKETCPFSRRVIAVLERLGIEYEKKDIVADEANAAELMKLGGKIQTPYLADSEYDFSHYESDDIVTHLQNNYSVPIESTTRPRVHVGGSTCVSCEG